MTQSLRLVEDLIPLIDLPADEAVAALQKVFGVAPAVVPAESPRRQRDSTPYEWRSAGVVLEAGSNGELNAISIYCDAVEGFQPFRGQLSEAAPLPEDRREVRKSLGEPSAGRTNPRRSLTRLFSAFGVATNQPVEWDRYERPDRVIHFEYDETRRVRRITLTSTPPETPER